MQSRISALPGCISSPVTRRQHLRTRTPAVRGPKVTVSAASFSISHEVASPATHSSGSRPVVNRYKASGASAKHCLIPTNKILRRQEPATDNGNGGHRGPGGRGPHPPGGSGGSGPGGSGDFSEGSGRGRMQPVTIAFGLFVLVGGVMGYKKKRSKDSLIASSIIAGLLLVSAYLMGRPTSTYGIRLAFVTTGSLAAYMGKGYYDKRKMFPQGVLTVLSSLLTIAYFGSL